MVTAGIDIGSLTAKAVIMKGGRIISSSIIPSGHDPDASARKATESALFKACMSFNDISGCCATGYGRDGISFAHTSMSEISCHAAGAFFLDRSIRTVIDIGGQDCKVICVDQDGLVKDFIMNDKCAAGTGRSLEILSGTLGVELEELGRLSVRSSAPENISSKCSIFMELEVLQHIYRRKKTSDIAAGIADAVARRVAALACSVAVTDPVCVTGGVSKNPGVLKSLEKLLERKFTGLMYDPQAAGAIGAAVFASGGRR